jgi:hypothetical protein
VLGRKALLGGQKKERRGGNRESGDPKRRKI